MTEARLRGSTQSQGERDIKDDKVSTIGQTDNTVSETNPQTSVNPTTPKGIVKRQQILIGSLLLFASIYWWKQTPAFDPSGVFESNSVDKLLACADRFAARVARVERVCKKLLEDGSPFKDVLINSEVNAFISLIMTKTNILFVTCF